MSTDVAGKPGEERTREVSAGIVVCRKTGDGPKFLLLYNGKGYWNFPKGKIETEKGERSLQTALRETQEETGLERGDLRVARGFKAYERFVFRRGNKRIMKTIICYLAYTEKMHILIREYHEGYGWFLFHEARKILGRYKESQKVLRKAYDFVRGESSFQRGGSRGKEKSVASREGAKKT